MLLLLLLITAVTLLCVLDFYKRQYWKRKGIVQTSSKPFFGHYLPVVLQKYTRTDIYHNVYKKYHKEPFVGIYEFWAPTLVINELKMIETIVIKKFSHFLNRPRWILDVNSYLNGSLFVILGNQWRAMRYKVMPWFTTNRMRTLFEPVLNLSTLPEGEFEALQLSREISCKTIGAFAGVELTNVEEFVDVNIKIHEVSNLRYYKLILVEHFSRITDFLGLSFVDREINKYLNNFLSMIVSNDDYSLGQRFQKLRNEKEITMRVKDVWKDAASDETYTCEVTPSLLTGAAGQFIMGGFDTSANAMAYLLYDLAMCPEAQIKAREEIRSTLQKHGGSWTYEAVQSMRYVANCISESMRLHPSVSFLMRECSTSTTLHGVTIDKGTKIIIPSLSVHMNPSIYPEPELFKPERFGLTDKQANIKWLAFGEGPRKCPGIRFSLMVFRTYLAKILENHELVFTEKTKFPVVADNRKFLLCPYNKMYMKLNKVS